MGLFSGIFGRKSPGRLSHEAFWQWFMTQEQRFHAVVRSNGDMDRDFFSVMSPQLDLVRPGFLCLAGMVDEQTAELILTPDGNIPNIVFTEELVAAAPSIPGWKFTALKPAMYPTPIGIEMHGFTFDTESLFFCERLDPAYPDDIDLVIIHPQWNAQNREVIEQGVFIFLDNYLGELHFMTTIDNLSVGGPETEGERVPIAKLMDYLVWREKEFQERYDDVWQFTETNNHAVMEGRFSDGSPLIATVNQDMLQWERKPSYPWMMVVKLEYDGRDSNGMPPASAQKTMSALEDELDALEKDAACINIGRQTGNNSREIYYACKDFRLPSKTAALLQEKYAGKMAVSYDIYKDKYWRTLERFIR